jgi:predicted HicB family RNase H-like nuclease
MDSGRAGSELMAKNGDHYEIGPDLDFDVEDFQYRGKRLTNERADQIAQDTLAEARRRNLIPGGKSLSGGGVHSPRVQFRVPEELRTQAERVAEDEGITLSVLARHALEDYVRSRTS